MKLIFIYGPAAVGKFTVATELSRLTGFKLFHNHVSVAAVTPVFGFGTPPYSKLVRALRHDVLEAAAVTKTDVIFTYVYAHPTDIPDIDLFSDAVEKHGGIVHFVQLVATPQVIADRASSPHRAAMGKLHTAESIHNLMASLDLFTPVPGRESLRIDTGEISAADAARRIATHFELPAVPPS